MNQSTGSYSIPDLMTIAMARQVRNGDFVILGVGTPMAAAAVMLARATHAPHATCFFYGAINPEVEDIATGLFHTEKLLDSADGFLSHSDVINQQQRGTVSLEFIRPVQIDASGSVNLSLLGDPERPTIRFGGPVAVPDSFVQFERTVVYISNHSPSSLVTKLDFTSAAGHLEGGRWRKRLGLTGGGPQKVITNLAILGFDPASGLMQLESVHPGVTPEQVADFTGFDLQVSPKVPTTLAPADEELAILKQQIDRHGLRRMEFKELRDTVMKELDEILGEA